MKKKMKSIMRKLVKISLNRLTNDAIFIGVNYALTGNVINAFGGLGTMKVISTSAFAYVDTLDMSPMKKSLLWELVISLIGLIVNGLWTGNIMMALKITMAMKVCIPINAWFFKNRKA